MHSLVTAGALLSALLLPGCAARGSEPARPAPKAPAAASPAEAAPAPGTALDEVAARLAADVAWLADDAREGRRAGTGGERAAAAWIAGRLGALGLAPAGEDGFFQSFPVPLAPRDGGGSSLAWDAAAGSPAGECADPALVRPLFCAAGEPFEGALVFCGYGIADAALGRDDFGAVEGAGKVAVIVRGVPPYLPASAKGPGALGFSNPDEVPDNWGGAGSIFLKVMNAKRRGFGAVLLLQHPGDASGVPPFDPSQAAVAGIPALAVACAVVERIAPGCTDALVRKTDAEALVNPPVELGPRARVRADVVRARSTATNVLGLVRGKRAERVVVVGAHFDHLGFGGPGSLAPEALEAVHNGADDNASGTAVVLELAARAVRLEPPCTLLFALWSGEELGLLGSDHWASHPTVPLARVAANLNLDMVGRAGDGELAVLGAGTSPAFAAWMEPAGGAAGLELDVSLSGQGIGGSDHQVFLRRGIPALHLFSGVHTDYHKPTDDTERFEAAGAARVAALAEDLTERLATAGELPFVEPEVDTTAAAAPRERGWSVWFGSVPSYTGDVEGLLLEGTSAGSPAEKAGLLKGDILTRVGDVEIANIHDFVYALQVYKPGDVVRVLYLRDGEPQEVSVTLSTRAAE